MVKTRNVPLGEASKEHIKRPIPPKCHVVKNVPLEETAAEKL
jgi:hypothetical protein